MRNVLQRGFAALLIVAVAVAGNLHLPLIQVFAWTRMYVYYHEYFPAKIAMEITFSGRNPCSLCTEVVTQEKETQKYDGVQNLLRQISLLPLPKFANIRVELPQAHSVHWTIPPPEVPAQFAQPETPPPRVA